MSKINLFYQALKCEKYCDFETFNHMYKLLSDYLNTIDYNIIEHDIDTKINIITQILNDKHFLDLFLKKKNIMTDEKKILDDSDTTLLYNFLDNFLDLLSEKKKIILKNK